jgi:hypothetical protein
MRIFALSLASFALAVVFGCGSQQAAAPVLTPKQEAAVAKTPPPAEPAQPKEEPAVAKKPLVPVVGDPQLKTDHPWFPGELSCSTFDRLFKTQSELYERVTGRKTDNDEDKAIASWYWRNLNYFHLYSPDEDYFGQPLTDMRDGKAEPVHEYWSGLFAYGFGLCGTTHNQFTAEMEYLLGHCRGRAVGVAGHNSFEVFLKDPQYGPNGDWALLDHDISTIVFDDPANPKRLLNLWQIAYSSAPPERTKRTPEDLESILDNENAPNANRGWFISGLYFTSKDNSDAKGSDAIGVYTDVNATEVLSGYASVPPMVSLKHNEVIRRYFKPGLGDKTYIFWGANDYGDKIPGPARGRTWVAEPERMFKATRDTDWKFGHYGNAVYTYKPNFADGSYREGVASEDASSVTFYFYSPYTIGTLPPADKIEDWWASTYPGGTEGLVITGANPGCTIQLSLDNGASWSAPVDLKDKVDFTDIAKSHHTYHLKFNAPAKSLAGKDITIRTICVANDRLMPHLKDGGTTITYQASGKAIFAAGPNKAQAQPFVTGGGFDKDNVEMTVPSPGGAKILEVYANGWTRSGSPPDPKVKYQIEYSVDGGKMWKPVIKDWQVLSLGYQSGDTWSQSFCFGNKDVSAENAKEVKVRFTNDGGVAYRKTEVFLVYETPNNRGVQVTFSWKEGEEEKTASHVYPAAVTTPDSSWTIPTGQKIVTNWVEMQLVE